MPLVKVHANIINVFMPQRYKEKSDYASFSC